MGCAEIIQLKYVVVIVCKFLIWIWAFLYRKAAAINVTKTLYSITFPPREYQPYIEDL